MKKFLLTLCSVLLGLSSFAGEVTFTFSDMISSQSVVTTLTKEDVKIDFSKGSNNNTSPTYYNPAIRLYGGNTFTITANNNITQIVLTFDSSDPNNAANSITATPGTFNTPNWSGSSSSVTFTIGGSSGNRRISAIKVTYDGTSSGGTTDPGTEPLTGDVLIAKNFTGISYTTPISWDSSTSGATYTAQATSNNGFQMRTSKTTGITVTTAPTGKKVEKIQLSFSTAGGGVSVYAGENPFLIGEKISEAAIATGVSTTTIVNINAPYFIIVPTTDTYTTVSEVVVKWIDENGGVENPEPGPDNETLTATFNFLENSYGLPANNSDYAPIPSVIKEGQVSITLTGTGSNAWRMWNDGLRQYRNYGAELTVTALNNGTITKITWETESGVKFALKSDNTKVINNWTGESESVSFVFNNSTTNNGINSITIEYIPGETNKNIPILSFDPEAITVTGLNGPFTAPTLTKETNGSLTYSSSNNDVATVNNDGVVTIVGYGSTYIKVVSAETDEYLEGEASYKLNVVTDEVLTVAQAIELIKNGYTLVSTVKGIISEVTISTQYGNADYVIKDNLEDENGLTVYRGYFLNGEKFTSEDQIQVGGIVTVEGELILFGGNKPEINAGNKIISYQAPGETAEEATVTFKFAATGLTGNAYDYIELTEDNEMQTLDNDVYSVTFTEGTSVVIKITPKEGYAFSIVKLNALESACSVNNGTYTFTLDDVSLNGTEAEFTVTDENEVGGLDSLINIKDSNDAIYNLQGVRVDANKLTKGIYIINGKKVMVK